MAKRRYGPRKKYVTEDYIEKVEHYLYNDLDITDLYDVSETVLQYDESSIKEILKKGEKYVKLKEDLDHVVVTSFGRVINLMSIKQYSVRFTQTGLHLYINHKKIDLPEIFLEQGWEFDVQELYTRYKMHNWTQKKYGVDWKYA